MLLVTFYHLHPIYVGWLEKWAVSRAYGLGTKLPWDPEYLVESLSDSTIYMAYYTIAHMLQNGEIYGKDTSLVNPEDVTDEVRMVYMTNLA